MVRPCRPHPAPLELGRGNDVNELFGEIVRVLPAEDQRRVSDRVKKRIVGNTAGAPAASSFTPDPLPRTGLQLVEVVTMTFGVLPVKYSASSSVASSCTT